MLMLGMAVSRVLCTAAGGERASSLMCRVRRPLTRRNDGRLGQRRRRRRGTVQAPNTDWKRRAYSMVMRHLSSSPTSRVASNVATKVRVSGRRHSQREVKVMVHTTVPSL